MTVFHRIQRAYIASRLFLLVKNMCMKLFYIALGTISLYLGIIGIVVPGLPTTPFLLLTASLYLKSSDRLYQKLLDNKVLGTIIKRYRDNGGMTFREKLFALLMMGGMVTISSIWLIHSPVIKGVVVLAGLMGAGVMIWMVPLAKTFDK